MDSTTNSMDDFYAELSRLPETISSMPAIQTVTVVPETTKSLTTIPTYAPPTTSEEPVDHESLKVYSIQQGKVALANMLETLQALQGMVVSTADGKLVNGYATLGGSITALLAGINTLGLAERKEIATKELETQKHQQKIELLSAKKPAQRNTVNIIAGREEIMKMLAGDGDMSRPVDNSVVD